jgi:hypothetical protein
MFSYRLSGKPAQTEKRRMTKYFLTTTILLLALVATTPAQNRSERQTLVGLRDMAVSVEYGQVDGLEASKRIIVLQHLQERATEQLTKAEIPVVKGSGNDVAGRPRLVFLVTANKDTQNAPTVVVQTKLYERVNLWRDATKEMNLATWVYDGVGVASLVTEKLISDVFDSQLNSFIKAYREANPNLKAGESTAASSVAPLGDNANSLQGLNGILFYVAFRRDVSPDSRDRVELQKALQKEAEAKLVQAGIPLLKDGSEEKAGRQLLYLFITLSLPLSDRHAIEIESNFWQHVRPLRDPEKQTYAVTWESQGNDGPPITDAAVRGVLNSQLDEFIKAYTAANPKPAARP